MWPREPITEYLKAKAGESRAGFCCEGLMHSHPHRLTHPDKRVCVVYSRQLGRMAKLGILCRLDEKSVFVPFLQSVFYHTPLHGRSGIQRCNKARESLHRLALLLQMFSPLTCWSSLFRNAGLVPETFFTDCGCLYLWAAQRGNGEEVRPVSNTVTINQRITSLP